MSEAYNVSESERNLIGEGEGVVTFSLLRGDMSKCKTRISGILGQVTTY